MVLAKFELLMSTPPPPALPPPPPAPISDVPERLDSPLPVTAAKISAVVVSTKRPVIATTALALCFPTPPRPNLLPYPPSPPPPTVVFLSSRPNCVMLPIITASTPRILPSFAAVLESTRSLFPKFCSPRTLSIALRSITEYLPSVTNFCTSMSEIPLPISWLVPKIAETELCTVPYSKLSTATRFFCCAMQAGTKAQIKIHTKKDLPRCAAPGRSRKLPTPPSPIGFVFKVFIRPTPRSRLSSHGSCPEFYSEFMVRYSAKNEASIGAVSGPETRLPAPSLAAVADYGWPGLASCVRGRTYR